MLIQTKPFGEMEIDESEIITFAEGIYAFDDVKRFALLYDADGENPFLWLQSAEAPDPCLLMIDPRSIYAGYDPNIPASVYGRLGADPSEKLHIFVMAVIREDAARSTVNLLGPVIISERKKTGLQEILDASDPRHADYKIRYPLFAGSAAKGGELQC